MGWRDGIVIDVDTKEEKPSGWRSGIVIDEEQPKRPIGATRDIKPNYAGRVKEGFDKARAENIERQKAGRNPIASTARTLTEAPYIAIGEVPGIKQAGKVAGKAIGALATGAGEMANRGIKKEAEYAGTIKELATGSNMKDARFAGKEAAESAPTVGDIYQSVSSKVPGTAKDIAETGMNIAGLATAPAQAKALSKGYKAVAKSLIKAPTKKLDEVAGQLAEWTTGVEEGALRLAGKKSGREALKSAYDKQYKIGEKLVDMVDNIDDYIPEREIVNEALNKMPSIDLRPVIKKIDDLKVLEASPHAIETNRRLERLKSIYSKLTTKKTTADVYGVADEYAGTSIPQKYNPNALGKPAKKVGTAKATVQEPLNADVYRQVRIQLDNEIKSAYSKDRGMGSLFEKQAMKIRKEMKDQLIRTAESSGNQEYVSAMKSWANKEEKISDLKKVLGSTEQSRSLRAESFIRNINNRGKRQAKQFLEDFEAVFGGDFVKQAKLAQWAEQIGSEGSGSLLPRWATGRSLWAKGPGFVVGSPKVASRVTLPATGAIRKIGEKVSLSDLAPASATAVSIPGIYNLRENKKKSLFRYKYEEDED
jgi:hypothetical protein